MIRKVYIAKDLDYARYEMRQDFPLVSTSLCAPLDYASFCRMHRRGLFSNKGSIFGFIGVDEYSEPDLKELIAYVEVDVIWAFKSLPKNHTLYKVLDANSVITTCTDYSNGSAKKALLKSCLSRNSLPLSLVEDIYQLLPPNPFIIESEISKLGIAAKVMPGIDLRRLIPSFETGVEVFDFMDSFFSGDLSRSYEAAIRVAERTPVQVLHSMFSKRITSLILLARGDYEGSQKFWRTFGQGVPIAKGIARDLGYDYLLELHCFVDDLFGNNWEHKSLFTRLCQLIVFHSRRKSS